MTQRPGARATGTTAIERAERRARALDLRKAGATYDQIAQRIGYSSRAAAYRDVARAIKEITAEPAADVLALELSRLDRLLMGIWTAASNGNQGAIDRVLRIMERRAKLLGLDQRSDEDSGTLTIVVDPRAIPIQPPVEE